VSERPLVVALNRGRILEECLPILEAAGIRPLESLTRSRKLVVDCAGGRVRLVVMRGADVPTYVEYGAADLGITGKDTLLEHDGRGYYERLDLGIARCRLMTAMPVGAAEPKGTLRVATKFVRVAERFFAARGRQAEIIRLSGAMEIAPLLGLADCIVDIVDTGNTLAANGLEARDVIARISTRVIVNRASLKLRLEEIEALLDRLSTAATSRRAERP
jgi:ATP phosphoribosyltransferase